MYLKVCRLCGKDNGLTGVFEEKDLCMKINTCFGVEIKQTDQITKKICKSCYFFTNTVFEFRVNSIEYDVKLLEAFKADLKTEEKPREISYPEISQDAFLNSLNLANKNDATLMKPPLHPSVISLKRKFPHINLPAKALRLSLDPYVLINESDKIPKPNSDLGIWQSRRSEQHDIILTRIREQLSDSDSDYTPRDFSNTNGFKERPSSTTPSTTSRKKRKDVKYPVYGSKKKRTKVSPRKPEDSDNSKKRLPEKPIETKQTMCSSQAVMNSKEPEQEKPNPVIELPPSLSMREDCDLGNLLLARGEEVQAFICQTCNKIFDSLQLLNNHKKYAHKSSLRCTKCSKTFTIVESLVKHHISCHPECVAKPTETSVNNGNPTAPIPKPPDNMSNSSSSRKSVARKKTSGSFENSNNDNIAVARKKTSANYETSITPNNPDIMEYVISSDDDVEITHVIDHVQPENEQASVSCTSDNQNTGSVVPEPQKNKEQKANADDRSTSSTRISTETQDIPNGKDKTKITTDGASGSTSTNNDVFLIDDSDDEKECSNKNKGKDNFLEKQSLSPSKNSKNKDTSSNTPSDICSTAVTSTDSNCTSTDQNLVLVPSSEDVNMQTSSSGKGKITNEQSYVNYIFNKCNFATNPQNQKKWFLKDIQRFTEKTFLPIEIIKGNVENLTVEYGPSTKEKVVEKVAFWDVTDVIDCPSYVKPLEPVAPKKVVKDYSRTDDKTKAPQLTTVRTLEPTVATVPQPTKVQQQSQLRLQGKVVKVIPSTSSIRCTSSSILSTACTTRNTITTVQSHPRTSTNVASSVVSTACTTRNAITTVQSHTRTPTNFATSVVSTACTTRNVITTVQSHPRTSTNIASASTNSANKSVHIMPKMTAANASAQPNVSPVGNSGPGTVANSGPNIIVSVANVKSPVLTNPSGIVGPSPGITPSNQFSVQPVVRNMTKTDSVPMNYVVQNDNMYVVQGQKNNPSNNIQFVSTGINFANNNVIIPSVANTSLISTVSSASNFDTTAAQKKLINLALQNAAANYVQQNITKTYGRSQSGVLLSKPILPVSPTRGNVSNSSEIERRNNPNKYFFIKDGVLQTPGEGSIIISSDMSNHANKISIPKPIVLNGMPYPTITQISNQEQPTYILQPNINIQNSISICQQDISNQTNESYTTTVTLPSIHGNALPAIASNGEQQIISSDQSQTSLAIVSSASMSTSETTVSTPRPMIRIKNLSELRENNLTLNQRNELHNLYTNALTNYVQNHASVMNAEQNNDEYLQIS